MPASAALISPSATVDPCQRLVPERPYVYAFALGDSPAAGAPILPGAAVTIDIADGTRPPRDPHDWFTARVPAIPPVSGPLLVAGIGPGDTLQVELLAIDEVDRLPARPLLLTVAVAASAGTQDDPMQVAIPVGGFARVPVRRRGGSIVFGPVMARDDRDSVFVPVAATVTVRCTPAS